MDIFPPTFAQAVLADFIREGHFARHLRRTRALYRERRGALVDAIRAQLGDMLSVLGDEAGMHLVASLSTGPNDRDASVRAARRGLWVMPLSHCYLGKASGQGFVPGFGGTSVPEILSGVRGLRTALGR